MSSGPRACWLVACLACLLAACLFAAPARADVQRFAVVIGSNAGSASQAPLRYAESDASRVFEVLRDLGGFAPANMVLLKGEDARTVEETLIATNERVRSALTHPDSQALLFVYYSGHADADALHLGRTPLSLRLFSQLVQGSSATFRLMVLDACRAGVATRRKGGSIVSGAPVVIEDRLPGSGLAVLAASAAHEDAQESDEIRGSFFTHAFVSGLLGAADQDADGAVSLSEAYYYAYTATLRESSRTELGAQHPTFRFDFAGQGAVVLTRPEGYSATRGSLSFPADVGFLVLRDGPDGSVVGEIGRYDRRRVLSVRPGRYFIRGRSDDVLFEGTRAVAQAELAVIDTQSMARVQYARLVRKGDGPRGVSYGIDLGPNIRSVLSNADTVCVGVSLGLAIELAQLGARLRSGACTSRFSNRRVEAVVNEYDIELRVTRTWDLDLVSLGLGLGAGAALFTQRFETRGEASARDAVSPYLLIGALASYDLGAGYAIGLDVTGETHLMRFEPMRDDRSSSTDLALRVALALARLF